jgi:hypothetical protein
MSEGTFAQTNRPSQVPVRPPAVEFGAAAGGQVLQGHGGGTDCYRGADRRPNQVAARGRIADEGMSGDQQALPAPGQALDRGVRQSMEGLFGYDFSRVRVHTDRDTVTPGRGTWAFTSGEEISFAAGRYAPRTRQGAALLAHELAHVLQQRRGGGAPRTEHETEASAAAQAVTRNAKPSVVHGSTLGATQCAPPEARDSAALTPPASAPSPGNRIIREFAARDGTVIEIEVGNGVARLGLEETLPSGTEVGLAGWHRAHSTGAGVGAESGRAIRYAPPEVNLKYQAAGIERFVRDFNRERDQNVRLFLQTTTQTHPRSLRLASITYRLSAARGTGRASALFEVTINIADTRANPRVWLDEPEVLGDWTEFLRPSSPAAQRQPTAQPSASVRAKPPAKTKPATATVEQPGVEPAAPLAPAKAPAEAEAPTPTPSAVEEPPTRAPAAPETAALTDVGTETSIPQKVVPAAEGLEVEGPQIESGQMGRTGAGISLFNIGMILLQFLPGPEGYAIQQRLRKELGSRQCQAQFARLEPLVHKSPEVVYYTVKFKVHYSARRSPDVKHFPEQYTVESVEILDIQINTSAVEIAGDLDPPHKPADVHITQWGGEYSWKASRVCTTSWLPVRPEIGPTYGLHSDTEIRQAVAKAAVETIDRIPVAERLRIINRLFDGWVSAEDIEVIKKVYRYAPLDQHTDVRQAISRRIPDLSSIGQRTELRVMLAEE